MAKVFEKLKDKELRTLPEGNHGDGGNLYLRVKSATGRSWVFRWRSNGTPAEMGLGSLDTRTLDEARALAQDMRRAIARGKNPKSVLLATKGQKVFREYAVELFGEKKHGWRNERHASQWINSLQKYAYPHVGDKPPDVIDTSDIKAILKPIWHLKPETAKRVRERIESVLDYGYIHEGLDKANPARWRGHLDKIFTAPAKLKKIQHYHAIDYRTLPEIMTELRQNQSVTAYCVQWILLTAARSSEARHALWSEIDMDSRIWIVPGDKMKSGKEHRVPLSDNCITLLNEMAPLKSLGNGLVFGNPSTGKPYSDTSIIRALKTIAGDSATIHGLRSSFRDWCSDKTNYPRELCEQALAHSIGSVESAYRRSDLIEKRRQLMEDWCNYLNGK